MLVFSYLNLIMVVIFWVVRIIATIATSLGKEIPITVFNMNVEIALLFITFFCFILILRRKILGAFVYMLSYAGYFGTYLFTKLSSGEIIQAGYLDIFIATLGVVVSILVFLDIGLNKNQKNFSLHKKTDWFYKNEQFNRQLDERADKNQYKF